VGIAADASAHPFINVPRLRHGNQAKQVTWDVSTTFWDVCNVPKRPQNVRGWSTSESGGGIAAKQISAGRSFNGV
jgi:hypothetical protein